MKACIPIESLLKVLLKLTCCCLLAGVSDCIGASNDTAFLYVSSTGKANAKGSLTSPFSSLVLAKDFCKQNRQILSGKKALVFVLSGGIYPLTQSIVFDKNDAAAFQNLPVFIRPAASAYVSINGGISVSSANFKSVTDKNVLSKLPVSTSSRIREVTFSLPQGMTVGTASPFGFQRPLIPPMAELFFDKKPMRLARYPNDTANLITKVDPSQQKIGYSGNRPQRWANAENAWVGGFFAFAWADDAVPLQQVDTKNNMLGLGLKPIFGIQTGAVFNRWYVFNLLEELDVQEEYYIDAVKKKAYFYPPPGKGNLEISLLADPMVVLNGVNNIHFQNITFENTRGNGVSVSECRDVVFEHCTFRNIGLLAASFGNGVEPFLNYGYDATKQPTELTVGSLNEYLYHNTAFDRAAGNNNGLDGCLIYNTGNGGVSLGGGNRKTLLAAGNFVQNSEIHHCNRLGKTYKGAINVDGVGNRIINNHLHNASQVAIYLHGNDHNIEDNEIDHCCAEANDMAAVYMGYDPSEVGNTFSGNYFHDILPRQPGYYVAAMFFDDGASNMTIRGNVFYKTGTLGFGAICLHGGFGFSIKENLFVNCPQAIRLNPWDLGKWNQTLQTDLWQNRLYKSVDVKNTAYVQKYPWLRGRLQSPIASLAENNVAINSSIFADDAVQQKNNCIAIPPGYNQNKAADFGKLLLTLKCKPAENIITFSAWKTAGPTVKKMGNPFDPYQ